MLLCDFIPIVHSPKHKLASNIYFSYSPESAFFVVPVSDDGDGKQLVNE